MQQNTKTCNKEQEGGEGGHENIILNYNVLECEYLICITLNVISILIGIEYVLFDVFE